MSRSCEGCRYWSEMVAESIGGGPVKAMCLLPGTSARAFEARMTWRGCESYEAGVAIDDPTRPRDEPDEDLEAVLQALNPEEISS